MIAGEVVLPGLPAYEELPKPFNAVRTVPLPDVVASELARYLEEFPPDLVRSLGRPGFGLWLWGWGEVAFDVEVRDPAEPGGQVPVAVAEQDHGAG
jgi:hypothetical protein